MTGEVARPPLDIVEAFATALVETGKASLDLNMILRAWAAADPGWAASTGARLRMAAALDLLATEGTVILPPRSGSRWDLALPPLPTRIVLPGNHRPPTRTLDPSTEPWVPALGWAAGWIRTARPPQRLRVALVTINRWLLGTTGRTVDRICREERSLQIFGDEKVLSSLLAGPLFAPGRLTYDTLGCDAPVGSIRIACLTTSGPVLVLENKATFDSAWRALHAASQPGYAALVFGGGDQAASFIPDLTMLHELVGVSATCLEYAGDIDIAGVSAAAAFLDVATSAGFDARPADRLWSALAAAAPSGEDLTAGPKEQRAAVMAAGRLAFPEGVATRLRSGLRVPQERLDRTALAKTGWWS